jgi:hypothetical protein
VAPHRGPWADDAIHRGGVPRARGLCLRVRARVLIPCLRSTPRGSRVPGLKDIFVVPQQIHMCLGSLADQLTYPGRIPAEDRTATQEAQLMRLLEMVGIGYLVKRWAGDRDDVVDEKLGWDCVARWEDVLSLG